MNRNDNTKTLILDFDSTLVDSIQAFIDVYNVRFKNNKDYKFADSKKHQRWDFSCVCPLLLPKDVRDIFDSEDFFKALKLWPNAFDVLQELSCKYNIIIGTIGTPKNLYLKQLMLRESLPFIHNFVGISNQYNKMDKSIINMAGATFVDDHQNNLFSCNAKRKILYSNEGKIYDWNKDWIGEKACSWLEVLEALI